MERPLVLRALLVAGLLLSVLAPLPTSAQPAPGEALYTLPDAPDDVKAGGGPGGFVPLPPGPLSDPLDIRTLRIVAEDGERIEAEVDFKDLRPMWQSRTFLSGVPSYALDFRIRLDDVDTNYRINIRVYNTAFPSPTSEPPAKSDLSADLCIKAKYECFTQPAQAALLWKANRVSFTFTKAALLGDVDLTNNLYGRVQPAKPAVPKGLPVGTPIQFVLFSVTNFFPYSAYDEVPNQGETPSPFLLTQPMANDRLKIYIPKTKSVRNLYGYGGYSIDLNNTTTVPVTPDAVTVIPIEVQNRADGKRIVNLSTEFMDPSAASKWPLQIVRTLEVPRGESRTVNLIVNVSKSLQHREKTVIKVHARAIGFPAEIGLVRMALQATLPPSPERTVIYWHGTASTNSGLPVQLNSPTGRYAGPQWLNVLPDDPDGTADQAGFVPGSYDRAVELDTDLSRDLVFDEKEPVKAVIQLSTAIPQHLAIQLRVTRAEEVLGEQKVLADLSSSPTPVTFAFPVKPDATRVKAGTGRLGLWISASRDDALRQFGTGFSPPVLHPKDSRIELPLIPDPQETLRAGIPKIFGLHVAQNTTAEFVNPGRSHRYEVVLINEGDENETAILSANADRQDWQVHIEPASKFRLKPGESVTFAVFVKSRTGATEGEQLRVDVLAQAERDERAVTRLPLLTTSISAPDIPDQSGPFAAKKEDLDKRADMAPAKSPGLEAWAIIALVALAAFARRRRAP